MLTNCTCVYYWQKLNSLLLIRVLSEACQVSMSAQEVFKWLCWDLADSQPTVNHHMDY